MASFSDTVKVLIDVDSTGATSGLANFRKSFSEAETATDKFKVVTGGAFDAIKNNAGAMALGAGTAIATFAYNAINDFSDLALKVQDFSDRTQFTLDQSSRWSEFTGDLGIQSDSMIKIFDKLGKAASSQIPAFEELGVEIAFGPNGATDIEETFLRVVDKLNSLEDPADRAKLSAQLLGKGWQDAAEIINMQSDDIRDSLDAISGEKIIDEEDVENAKNLREAQDKLNDAIEEFTIKVGSKLIPAFTSIIDAATPVVDFLGKFNEKFDFWDVTAVGIIENVASKMSGWFGDPGLADMIERMKLLEDQTNKTIDPTDDLAVAWAGGYRAMIDAAGAADGLEEALGDVDEALSILKGNIDERQAFRNLIDTVEEAGEAALIAFAEKTPESLRAAEDALDEAREKVALYVYDLDGIPETRKTDFITALDTASYEQVKAMLAALQQLREVPFMPVLVPGQGGINEIGSGGRPIGSEPVRIPRPGGTARPRIASLPTASSSQNVTVNVGGSVVSQADLVESIRVGLINAQRSGKQLVYSNQ